VLSSAYAYSVYYKEPSAFKDARISTFVTHEILKYFNSFTKLETRKLEVPANIHAAYCVTPVMFSVCFITSKYIR